MRGAFDSRLKRQHVFAAASVTQNLETLQYNENNLESMKEKLCI